MPKEGLPHAEWVRRLRLYAKGEYVFGRGNAPPPNSQWAKRKTSIDSCPVKKARMDIFGNPTTYKCGFHPVNVSVKVIILNYVDKKSAN